MLERIVRPLNTGVKESKDPLVSSHRLLVLAVGTGGKLGPKAGDRKAEQEGNGKSRME